MREARGSRYSGYDIFKAAEGVVHGSGYAITHSLFEYSWHQKKKNLTTIASGTDVGRGYVRIKNIRAMSSTYARI